MTATKPAIIIRVVNKKHKTALLKQERKLKGSNVFMNEHLMKQNADIATKACYLKKQGKLQNAWTTNCKVLIKLNETPKQAKVLVIRNIEELDKYQWSLYWTVMYKDSNDSNYNIQSWYSLKELIHLHLQTIMTEPKWMLTMINWSSTFQYTDLKWLDLESDTDLDNNFFFNVNSDCYYYPDDQFNQTIKSDSKLSFQ